MAFNGVFIINAIFILVFGVVYSRNIGENSCGSLKTGGYTVPKGDITLRYGEPLDITCNLYEYKLNEYGKNASLNLSFRRNGKPVPPEMIEILNSTSIRLHIDKPPKVAEDNYICVFEGKKEPVDFFCMNVVMVGLPPQPVTDFKCISLNYDNLTCKWTPPENYVRTDYNLTFSLKGRASRFLYKCPTLKFPQEGEKQMSCFWNISTTPQYRQAHSVFYFRLGMNNTFGSNYSYYPFKHFENVLPNAPENLTAKSLSSETVKLSWVVPSSMQSFPMGVHHRVMYQWEHKSEWHFAQLITNFPKNKSIEYLLTELKYGHALCDIRVSIRAASANVTDENMWSQNASITIRTEDRLPLRPPRTEIGSFEIDNDLYKRNVYVYWQHIKEEEKNGDNFTYHVIVEGDESIKPFKVTKAFAHFKNLLKYKDYKFRIWSSNIIGLSKESAIVDVPKTTYDGLPQVPEPLNFIKVALTEELYGLSWEPPKKLIQPITNYTLFWCRHERDRPFQCDGNLNWKVVPNDTISYNQTLSTNYTYQFAISANTEKSSSGMIWAECTILPDKSIGKLKNIWIKSVGSNFIHIGWKVDCYDRIGMVKGFVIYYCPIQSLTLPQCIDVEKNYTVYGDTTLTEGTITDLKPYTIYRMTVGVISKHSSHSQLSDPFYYTTNEAAPSSAPHITASEITNSSFTINWEPLRQTNGILKFYSLRYNNKSIEINPPHTDYKLTNLRSYETYYVTLQACTVGCSAPSDLLNVTTLMWYPGPVKQPSVTFQNGSFITVTWDKPNPPRGKIDYYQVQFKQKLDHENKTIPLVNVTSQKYSIDNCGDSGKYNTFFIAVRAVNMINGDPFEGPWSDELESYCRSQYNFLLIIVVSSLSLFFVIAMFWFVKKLYVYCKLMQDVEVKLPPGLAPVIETSLVPWPSEKHTEDIDRHEPADEELLLEKINEIRGKSGDSSGCSSGHDSATSTLESGTHISASDSGTDQPRTPSTEELRRNSLRQRNVSTARPTVNKGYVVMPPDNLAASVWNPKPPQPGSYCVLGVDPGSSEPEKSYVPITASLDANKGPYISCDLVNQPSPPYVMTGDMIKTQNPGYIPYNSPDTSTEHKNTGYVVAGINKDILVPEILQCDSMKAVEEIPVYATSTDNMRNVKSVEFPWHQQPQMETSLPKSGYVSVGEVASPKAITEHAAKGYVPHRQFEAKSLKED